MSAIRTSVVLLNVAAAVSAAFAVFAAPLWTKGAVKEIRARELRLTDIAHALKDYAAEQGHFPLVASCAEMQRLLVPRFSPGFSCEETRGGIRYAAVSTAGNCGSTERACPPIAGAGFLLVSPGADARISRETAALLDAAPTASRHFTEREATIASSAALRQWYSFVDDDIIRTESGFLSTARIAHPWISPPETIRTRFMIIGGAATLLLLTTAWILKRRSDVATGQQRARRIDHEDA